MSKSVASKSNYDHETQGTDRKRGEEDEGGEDGEGFVEVPRAESLPISTTVSTVPATTDQFMHTPEFRRHFVEFVPDDMLMTLRLATKGWKADAFIDEGVKSGEIVVHNGKDISNAGWAARKTRRRLRTRVIFLLNVAKVGGNACAYASNLVVVKIPEGVTSIHESAFLQCQISTTVSFPTTLTSIGDCAFYNCSSLYYVNFLHTNLQKLGEMAFYNCSELKSMTDPDSFQRFNYDAFSKCSKLVLSNIADRDSNAVVAHLRSK